MKIGRPQTNGETVKKITVRRTKNIQVGNFAILSVLLILIFWAIRLISLIEKYCSWQRFLYCYARLVAAVPVKGKEAE